MSNKVIEYYLGLPYKIEIFPEDDGTGFTAVIPDLPGCMTSSDSLEELYANIEEAKELWLEVAIEDGTHIPEPKPVEIEEYSGKFLMRIPKSLHRDLSVRARVEGCSLNQLVGTMLSEDMGRWTSRVAEHQTSNPGLLAYDENIKAIHE